MVVDGEPGAFEQGHMLNRLGNHRIAHLERGQRRLLDQPHGVQKSFGGKHPETLDHLVTLAHMLVPQGRLVEAEQLFTQAWQGRKAKFGENHPMTHRSLRDLAEIKKRLGMKEEAADLLHSQACHGFSTRYQTTTRPHAASLRSTQDIAFNTTRSTLRSAGRLSILEKELAGRSFSEGSLMTQGKRTSMKQSTSLRRASSLSNAFSPPRQGRRLYGEAAEILLREFGDALFAKYSDVQTAFRSIDVNGTGTITGSEFVTDARQIFDGDNGAVFKVLDDNRSGDISVKEFDIFNQLRLGPPEVANRLLNENRGDRFDITLDMRRAQT